MHHHHDDRRRSRAVATAMALIALSTAAAARAQPDPDADVEVEVEAEGEGGAGAEVHPADEPSADLPPEDAQQPHDPEVAVLRRELDALRRQFARLEKEQATRATPAAEPVAVDSAKADSAAKADAAPPSGLVAQVLGGLTLSGYVQAQYLHSALSEDQLLQGQVPLNQDGFAVRRGRLRVAGMWHPLTDWLPTGVELEIDGNTNGGPIVTVRRANVWLGYTSGRDAPAPWVALKVGLTEIPFGLELRQNQEDRLFMERTTGSDALFPGPTDLGARLYGSLGPFRYDLAATNGSPIDDRIGTFEGDPTAAPDWAGRLGVDQEAASWLHIAGGASFLYGTGFHPGRDAEKNRLEWRDLNENGTLDTGEVSGVPARGATPSETFARWALGADLAVTGRWAEGFWTQVYGEATVATNLDRGLFVADPIFAGTDLRELSYYVALVQDVTPWAFAGVRYDSYDPDIDLLDAQRGVRVPVDGSIRALSPLIGARIPGRARLSFQYDAIFDSLGRDLAGVPTDVRNDRFTARVQGDF